ncbi:hypothetical protein EV213_11852 [Aureibacillus halotolerans]|uniref:Uncharacterized protein n=1 Tax=Aureibacillus halotolerans TaxID=1508390 RepID=A0A4R6TUW5_9BACI|nr:hypothetical protein EV213_11852 [Aureibacillus halotolerans]
MKTPFNPPLWRKCIATVTLALGAFTSKSVLGKQFYK